MKPEYIKQMQALFNAADIQLSSKETESFAIYYDMLNEYNEEYDLTRLRTFEDIIIKHFIDSVYITKFTSLPASLADIGTGAGFPGLPLKIMNPNLRLTLAEPKAKRVEFLSKVVERLGLDNVAIYPHLVTEKTFFSIDAIITRAFASAEDTLARVQHFLHIGGKAFLLKGPSGAKEAAALPPELTANFALTLNKAYTLPNTPYKRRLLIFDKTQGQTKRTHIIFKRADETLGTPITSGDNKTFRELKNLSSSSGMKKAGRMLVSGRKLVKETMASSPEACMRIVLPAGWQEQDEDLNAAYESFAAEGRLLLLSRGLFSELEAPADGPLLERKLPSLQRWEEPDGITGCILAVAFQDPLNVGAVIRSAAAFGVQNVVLLKEAAFPFHPKAVRASSGAVFNLNLFTGPSLSNFMHERGNLPVAALDAAGEPIEAFIFPRAFYLLPGIEGGGLPPELRRQSISIPISDAAESLNGAVAAAVALWEWKRRLTSG